MTDRFPADGSLSRSLSPRVRALFGTLAILLALAAPDVAASADTAWIPWSDAAIAHSAKSGTRPLLILIGDGSCIECSQLRGIEVGEGELGRLWLDADLHPELARAYLVAARVLGASGPSAVVVVTPDLEPVAATSDLQTLPEFVSSFFSRWKAGPTTVSDQAALAIRRYRLNGGALPFEDPMTARGVAVEAEAALWGEGRENALTELRRLTASAVYDQLGGGFHRAARDSEWRVPRFEKRLADQTLLIETYLDASRITDDPLFSRVARDSAAFLVREMSDVRRPLFFNALGPKSLVPRGGPEMLTGAYYSWQISEITALLGDDARPFIAYYGMAPEGNVPAAYDPAGALAGRNVLFVSGATSEPPALDESKQHLLAVRMHRPPPTADGKAVTEYEAAAISALARSSIAFDNDDWGRVAVDALHALDGVNRDSKSHALYRERAAGVPALLADYVYLVQANLDVYALTFDPSFLHRAVELQKECDALFLDQSSKGYAAAKALPPPVSGLTSPDPIMLGVLARDLGRIGAMTADAAMVGRATTISAGTTLPAQLIVAGDRGDAAVRALLEAARSDIRGNLEIRLFDRKSARALAALFPYAGFVAECPVAFRIEKSNGRHECSPFATLCDMGKCRTPTADPAMIAAWVSKGTSK
ncbi:MAG: hypothetical protein WBX15_05905 [Thermoanaerobaculia bacterium]